MYEQPSTAFVAGFLGTTNLIEAEGGSAKQMVSIRPEKIRILAINDLVPTGMHSAPGVIRDVVYLGTFTRYLVELQGNTNNDLVVMEQNIGAAAHTRGQHVTLAWQPEHMRGIG